MRERTVEQHLIRSVRAVGGLAVKHASDGRAGDPDRLVASATRPCPAGGSRARVSLVEVKAPGKVPRPLQLLRLDEWRRLGVDAAWVDSHASVDEWLKRRIQ